MYTDKSIRLLAGSLVQAILSKTKAVISFLVFDSSQHLSFYIGEVIAKYPSTNIPKAIMLAVQTPGIVIFLEKKLPAINEVPTHQPSVNRHCGFVTDRYVCRKFHGFKLATAFERLISNTSQALRDFYG